MKSAKGGIPFGKKKGRGAGGKQAKAPPLMPPGGVASGGPPLMPPGMGAPPPMMGGGAPAGPGGGMDPMKAAMLAKLMAGGG